MTKAINCKVIGCKLQQTQNTEHCILHHRAARFPGVLKFCSEPGCKRAASTQKKIASGLCQWHARSYVRCSIPNCPRYRQRDSGLCRKHAMDSSIAQPPSDCEPSSDLSESERRRCEYDCCFRFAINDEAPFCRIHSKSRFRSASVLEASAASDDESDGSSETSSLEGESVEQLKMKARDLGVQLNEHKRNYRLLMINCYQLESKLFHPN